MNVCYFAAGTLCNLLLSWSRDKSLGSGSQSDLMFVVVCCYFYMSSVWYYKEFLCNEFYLSIQGNAVNKWKEVDKVMVGYR